MFPGVKHFYKLLGGENEQFNILASKSPYKSALVAKKRLNLAITIY
jgi:hypothetical protein